MPSANCLVITFVLLVSNLRDSLREAMCLSCSKKWSRSCSSWALRLSLWSLYSLVWLRETLNLSFIAWISVFWASIKVSRSWILLLSLLFLSLENFSFAYSFSRSYFSATWVSERSFSILAFSASVMFSWSYTDWSETYWTLLLINSSS